MTTEYKAGLESTSNHQTTVRESDLKTVEMFIVQVTENFYIANVGLTSLKGNAKRYNEHGEAELGLALERTIAAYGDAIIINIETL